MPASRPVLALLIGLALAVIFAGSAPGLAEDAAASPEQKKLLATFVAEFVEITPGKDKFPAKFEMGSNADDAEQPVHAVTIARPFAIAKYEVPQKLYEVVMGANPSKWKGPRNSAENFTFGQAVEFCQKATALLRAAKQIRADEEIRLPTEAEWEYCCRAGTTTAYSFGDKATGPDDAGKQASLLDPYGWHTGNAAGNDPPVGALKPNPWGLYDMHGYLWEFVADDWHDSYAGAPADGSAWKTADEKAECVVRGGSWQDRYDLLRSSYRKSVARDFANDGVGFRCVLASVQIP